MSSIRSKLRSRTGASITYALLLFLVCAVVGSVVLTAGSAAGGRLSQLTAADRRYYAVTSAAQLFREKIEEDGVVVKRVKTTNLSKAPDGTVSQTGVIVNTSFQAKANKDGTLSDAADNSLPKQAAVACLFHDKTHAFVSHDGVVTDWNDVPWTDGSLSLGSLTMTLPAAISDSDKYTVTVTVTEKPDGSLICLFESAPGDHGEIYRIRMTFTAEVKRSESQTESAPTMSNSDIVYTRTETRTDTFTWKLTKTEKVGA